MGRFAEGARDDSKRASIRLALAVIAIAFAGEVPIAAASACPSADSTHFIVTSTGDSGDGSLRGAMGAAQNANGGTVCIDVGTSTITLSTHIEYQGTGALTIIGNGATVSGGNEEGSGGGILNIEGQPGRYWPENVPGAALPLSIQGLTFANGLAHDGGALWMYNVTASITNCVFSGNTAEAKSVGGAIYQYGDESYDYPPTIIGSLTVSDSSFVNNRGECSDCAGDDGGGAITTNTIPVIVARSSFIDNSTSGPGGAIDALYGSSLVVLASTFSGNSATGGTNNQGGAINSGWPTTIVYSTFSGNDAPTGSAIGGSEPSLFGNVIAGTATGPLCEHAGSSLGYNFATETANSCGLNATGDSSLDANDPGLGSVTSTQGLVQQSMSPGAPLIAAIPNASCYAADSLVSDSSLDTSTDELNGPRPLQVGGDCTIGAVEPTGGKCPHPHGYWKTNPGLWPVSTLMLGSQTYSKTELLKILKTAVGTGTKADASLILADQLIAAKLNVANGSDPTAVASTIDDSDSLLGGFLGKLPYKVKTTSAKGKSMVADANTLNGYNNGQLTAVCQP